MKFAKDEALLEMMKTYQESTQFRRQTGPAHQFQPQPIRKVDSKASSQKGVNEDVCYQSLPCNHNIDVLRTRRRTFVHI